MPLISVTGPTIAAGQSLSDALDLSDWATGGQLMWITAPAVWTPALLSFMISSNDGLYNPLFAANREVLVGHIAPGRSYLINPRWPVPIGFLKFRSGKQNFDVPQEAEAVFTCIVLTT